MGTFLVPKLLGSVCRLIADTFDQVPGLVDGKIEK